jgi:hypothetical protein
VLEEVTADDLDSGHGMKVRDNEASKNKMMEWTESMWANGGNTRIWRRGQRGGGGGGGGGGGRRSGR